MGILRTDTISGLETPTPVTGSVSFDGNDHLSIGSAGDFNFLHNGATDWTVEFWAKTGTATRQFVWGTGASSAQTGFYLQIMSASDAESDATGVFASVGRGAAGNYIGWGADNCLTVNTWHHIAAVFKSSDKTLAIYVDGKEVDNGTGTVNGTPVYSSNDSTHPLLMGENPHANVDDLNGEISNLRVVAGRRLYTSEFTPPVHALEPINGTVVLCCNNPDSVTSSSNAGIGTAHIITTSGDPTVGTDYPGLTRDFTSGTQFQGVAKFDTQGYFVPPSGTTEQRSRGRGVFGGAAITGGGTGTGSNSIEFITISSLGNSQDFGDLTDLRRGLGACSSSTRGLFGGGYRDSSGYKRNIDYITISTSSNAINFGDLTDNRLYVGAVSNNTRGVFGSGEDSPVNHNILDFVTIASLGTAQTFGELSGTQAGYATLNSPTRGVFAGGNPVTNAIQYITIATTGSAQSFGQLSAQAFGNAGVSSPTRGVIAFGQDPALVNTIEFITIATTGSSQDFGDTTVSRTQMGETSNSVRGVFIGGRTDTPTPAFAENTMDYVTIASTGNALDFGDLVVSRQQSAGLSDSHGGIS